MIDSLGRRKLTLPILVLCLGSLLISACASPSSVSFPTDLRQTYLNAVKDAQIAGPEKIAHDLTAIVPYNRDLVWKGEPGVSKVLVVTWTGWDGYDGKTGKNMTAARETWVTAAPELKKFCSSRKLSTEALTLRLEQLMGLPPGSGKTRFVEIWVDPDDLFRPSPDPEITDHEAELDFPRSTRFASVGPDHVRWFNALREKSYGSDGYPWTRLGYTYDWGNPAGRRGLSEFVIRSGAEIEIRGVAAIESYCR